MQTRSEGYNLIAPLVIHLRPSPQVVFPLIMAIVLALSIPLFIPVNLVFLVAGLAPMVLSHPYIFPLATIILRSNEKTLITYWRAFRDNDRLSEIHWQHGLCEVELWENERWDKDKRVWRNDPDRKRWTRSADGWSPLNGEGQVRSVIRRISHLAS
jgi:hypothetical protein